VSSSPSTRFSAVILSGDRGPNEALNLAAKVCCKALVPVGGRAMLLRVLDTLSDCSSIDAPIIAGLDDQALQANAELRQRLATDALARTPKAAGPSAAAAAAAETVPASTPILITTADHALLEADVVEHFLHAAAATGLDVVAAVIRYPDFHRAHPQVDKTVMRFSDDHYCGCNLFALLTPAGRRILNTWQQVEAQRKTPWKTVGLIGWTAILRYLTGRLSISQATTQLSQRLGIKVGVVVLPTPDAAIDVDTIGDWQFVEALLAQRQAATTRPPGSPTNR
jgi:CTP:molybdopterin cytidylyltransferase MocA